MLSFSRYFFDDARSSGTGKLGQAKTSEGKVFIRVGLPGDVCCRSVDRCLEIGEMIDGLDCIGHVLGYGQ